MLRIFLVGSFLLIGACSANLFDNSITNKTELISKQPVAGKVSRFGHYSGYTERKYDGYDRESKYVAVRDGTRMAVDVYYPTRNGQREEQKLPVLMYATHYHRATIQLSGNLTTHFKIEEKNSQARFLLEHGYVIIAYDVRGSGASFGKAPTYYNLGDVAGNDTYDLIEWAAQESWSTGKIGMFGGSYMGHTQVFAAAKKPPSLKAIFPSSFSFDLDVGSKGTVRRSLHDYIVTMDHVNDIAKVDNFNETQRRLALKLGEKSIVAPVEGPLGSILRDKAIGKRAKGSKKRAVQNTIFSETLNENSIDIAAVIQSKIPTYTAGGLYDWGVSTPLLWYQNLTGPKKAVVGPWTHGPDEPNDPKSDAQRTVTQVESLRWYDYWLKGIDNGIMDEPPLNYAVIGSNNNHWAWLTGDQWPLPTVDRKDFYFSTSTKGLLLIEEPELQEQESSFTVDYSASTGTQTRYWDAMGMGPLHYPEMSDVNNKGIFYTSEPMEQDIAIVGAPIIELYLTATTPDAEVNVYLEKVLLDKTSMYVTDGVLMASWRKLKKAPYDFLGWPYVDGSKAAIKAVSPLNEEVAKLEFNLRPVGMVFEKGSRIRILITGADAGNSKQVEVFPPPSMTIFSGLNSESKISLPILKNINLLSVIN